MKEQIENSQEKTSTKTWLSRLRDKPDTAKDDGWLGVVSMNFERAIKQGEIKDPQLVEEMERFVDQVTSSDFRNDKPSAQADRENAVPLANQIIDKVLEKLPE